MRTKELAAMLQGNWEEEPEENDTPAELRLKTAMKKVVNACPVCIPSSSMDIKVYRNVRMV